MNLISLQIQQLTIPFKISFSHASASRNQTDSVLITATSKHHISYGESCPRGYVTHENYTTCQDFFQRHHVSLLTNISDLTSLQQWQNDHKTDIDQHPAAWCAIELALLDLLAKENQQSVEQLLNIPALKANFQYSAILGDSSIDTFVQLLSQYHAMGFQDFKLKLSGDLDHDHAKCQLVTNIAPEAKIRLDANNLWADHQQVINYIQSLEQPFFAIEEPIRVCDYQGLTTLAQQLDTSIILDESFTKIEQFDFLKSQEKHWIINIRISKMGGLMRSLAIADKAQKLGIKCIVGAQVGETSILTRVALSLVNCYRDIIIAQEGACGTYLLEHDICQPILMFAKDGQLPSHKIAEISETGFGLDINP